jgi:hypothetical protein
MLAPVQVEWCLVCATVNFIVVAELSQGKPLRPVILSIIDEEAKVLFNLLVKSLCLTIGLWVIGC